MSAKISNTQLQKKPATNVENDKQATIIQQQTQIAMEQFSGPIPHPDILKGYEQILPGMSERILVMAEEEQKHRHSQESAILKTESRDSLLGIIAGFVISILALAAGVIIAIKVPVASGAIAGSLLSMTGIVLIIITFIKTTRTK